MINHTLRAALVAASAAALAGCLDTDSTGPSRQCELNATPPVAIAGDTVRAANGLKYIDVAAGEGAQIAANGSADVCYVGSFTNGQVFDLGSFVFEAGEGNYIAGFEQGVVGMRAGGIRRLIVPPSLGYGDQPVRNQQGQVVIPANSTLVFDVGVMRVR